MNFNKVGMNAGRPLNRVKRRCLFMAPGDEGLHLTLDMQGFGRDMLGTCNDYIGFTIDSGMCIVAIFFRIN